MKDAARIHWDVIVIGAGMGGATIGHALAQAGKRVVFCERGRAASRPDAVTGRYPETGFRPASAPQPEHEALLAGAGRDWNEIDDASRARRRSWIPFVGAGTGGSSALYGMALERLYPTDFTPRIMHPDAPGADLPDAWPIDYAELVPFYEAAERLYRVRGEADPLRGDDFRPAYLTPPVLTRGAEKLRDYLRDRGCHPYRLPQACEFEPRCECCQGYLCPRECKNDSGRICLEPALARHGASLLEECEVLHLEADATRVTGVVCRHRGETHVLRGRVVILAAGALYSPAILLASRSTIWPDGLANRSGLVGRNLMRHFIDLYVLRSGLEDADRRWKEIAFNDCYADGSRFGSVQSFGALPPAAVLVASLRQDVRHAWGPIAAGALGLAGPAVRAYLERTLSRGPIMASIQEDLPYRDNRIVPGLGNGGLGFVYRIRPQDRVRIRRMRAHLRGLFAPFRPMLLAQAENNQRLAHVCGTCRFGADPATSVLDRDNRAHGVDNLFVVDASFFPTSGGINPALTVAANALRVAARIATA
ncbi:MAG TPA: GMC family oxidoreductase [Thiobacillaceae bacterium]|nr:GMC family oxidoreductase [Thiobacillaceae bacterium]